MRLIRATSFSAAHRYFNPALSEAENRKLFGSFYREDGFGHNFGLELHIEGEVDELTGMIVNLTVVDQWLKELLAHFDHRHLNEVTVLKGRVPTPEVIAEVSLEILKSSLAHHLSELRAHGDSRKITIHKVRVIEGNNLWVDAINGQ